MTLPGEKEMSEIKSLLTLLDDESDMIFETARTRLLDIGRIALPYLNPELFTHGTLMHARVSEIYEATVAGQFREQLRAFIAKNPSIDDLEEAIILIAKQRYPFLDAMAIHERLATMSRTLSSRIDTHASPVECVQTVTHYFCEEMAYNGNRDNHYDEQNHYINRVMDTRTGSPILLSILYMIVGRKINLPIQGIGLPGRFIVRFDYPQRPIYIDPFDRGRILSRIDCEQLIENSGRVMSAEYFTPMTVPRIMERVFRNLIIASEHKGDTERARVFAGYIDIVNAKVYIE
jgi:regulator of sirC expression with transglutaminase-like and TPR domain